MCAQFDVRTVSCAHSLTCASCGVHTVWHAHSVTCAQFHFSRVRKLIVLMEYIFDKYIQIAFICLYFMEDKFWRQNNHKKCSGGGLLFLVPFLFDLVYWQAFYRMFCLLFLKRNISSCLPWFYLDCSWLRKSGPVLCNQAFFHWHIATYKVWSEILENS